jgi:Zn-dependent oligopeptidase
MLTSLATGLKERLEDETEAVMIEAINCSIKYLNFLPHKIATDDTKVTKSVDALLTSLVLHMDNENVEIRLLLLNSLQEKLQQGWIKIRLLEHATKAQEVHRHREEIQKLVSSLSMALEPPIEE